MRRIPGAFLGALLLLPAAARADDSPDAPSRRRLGQHLFIPRETVLDPFTASYVSSSTGLGYGFATGPTFDLNGNPVNLADYKIASYSQLFSGQWGIADFWAVRLQVLGSLYSGANAPGVAGVGVNGVARGAAGTTLSFQLADNLRLGALVDVTFGPSIGINILDSIRQSIAQGAVETPVSTTSTTTVTPAVSLAWAIARGFGSLFNVSFVHGNVDVNSSSADVNALILEAAFDMDLRELGSIPLGIAANASAGYSTDRSMFRRYVYGLGFFYTGRKGLTLGLDLTYRRTPLGTRDIFTTSISALISLRYTFD
jgi:hypothetical protein